MEQAWARHMQQQVGEKMSIHGISVEAPFLLSSAPQARCCSQSQARSLVSVVRQLQPSFDFMGSKVNIYATLQKPNNIKEKNKLLLRTAEKLQSFLHPAIAARPLFKCICWKSSNVVIQDRRICNITRNDDATYHFDFAPNWFDARIFVNTAKVVEQAVRNQLDDSKRPIE